MAYTSTNIGARNITNGVTTVDCHKQVRSWRLLRSLMELLIPTCNCTFIEEEEEEEGKKQDTKSKKSCQNNNKCSPLLMSSSSTTITGTIFGYRKGKVCFCIQSNKNSTNPILLLELAVPTSILAKEMRGGTLRIVLESSTNKSCNNNNLLFSTPLWTMYCNGRKVGYAVKRRPSNSDFEALSLMSFVEVGTGVINNGKELQEEDELMYLRANFQRVRGSSKSNNCESFHLIDPEGSIGQELSIFLFQSR
ncbi:PREDICTED: protein MIZU-KUSSEI 1-like [Lupinus angustifolius]|uniref:protein MIZU-KUSSEI 1-like n=1 Tax=Lupinus angustifolius TaxID=3871 RepID=UPI00092EBD90|nr:PREDICTED: protein MIZU-KUSSEI 1-like [Lupinus angustifolius]